VLLRAWVEADDPPTDEAFRDGSFAEEPPHDWEAEFRSGFRAERVSERITVAPPWDAPPGAVIIEPGQGFGTGAHETTRAALRALDRWCVGCRTVLDVGCGSGVLALAGARLGLRARGVDVEAAAVREARRAARVNGLRATFSTRPVASLVTPADLVVANLHAELIVALARPLRRLTRRRLILAGILADREALVTARFADWELLGRDVDGEWVCHVWAAEPGSET
jgi:ribosomal protein L11 methyltransferase